MYKQYETAKKDFLSGRIKGCRAFFENNKYYTEAGYCYIMLDRLDKAEAMFNKAIDYDSRANWGLFLLDLINGVIKRSPTYFQIRNFLEIDLSLLILYCKGAYIEKIIKYSDFMAFYNPECHKFIGRAFWANKLLPAAMFYLNKAKDKFYQDPELHYLLAYIYYYDKHDMQMCKKSLRTCLEILPEYAPAEHLMKLCKF